MKKRGFKIIVLILIALEITFIFLSVKSFNNKAIIKNKTDDQNSMFALFLDDEPVDSIPNDSDDGIQKISYILNKVNTKCVDADDNIQYGINQDGDFVDSNVSIEIYDDNTTLSKKIKVTSKKTVYCNLYFTKTENNRPTFKDYLINNFQKGLNLNPEDGMYRFVGNTFNVDNFICFGTYDKDECINNKEKYMYRIIGINHEQYQVDDPSTTKTKLDDEKKSSAGELKLIKYLPILDEDKTIKTFKHSDDADKDTNWTNSKIKEYLNVDFINSFDSAWKTNISDVKWMKHFTWGSGKVASKPKESFDNYEKINIGHDNEFSGIGLMGVNDYMLSSGDEELCFDNYTIADISASKNDENYACSIGWLYFGANYTPEICKDIDNYGLTFYCKDCYYDSSNTACNKGGTCSDKNCDKINVYTFPQTSCGSDAIEGTMVENQESLYPRTMFVFNTLGGVNIARTDEAVAVRPVFYLRNSALYGSGSGTLEDPFIIYKES